MNRRARNINQAMKLAKAMKLQTTREQIKREANGVPLKGANHKFVVCRDSHKVRANAQRERLQRILRERQRTV